MGTHALSAGNGKTPNLRLLLQSSIVGHGGSAKELRSCPARSFWQKGIEIHFPNSGLRAFLHLSCEVKIREILVFVSRCRFEQIFEQAAVLYINALRKH